MGKGNLKRASGAFRRATQKHAPVLCAGCTRFSRRGFDEARRGAVRAQERVDLRLMLESPDHETLADERSRVDWRDLDPYW